MALIQYLRSKESLFKDFLKFLYGTGIVFAATYIWMITLPLYFRPEGPAGDGLLGLVLIWPIFGMWPGLLIMIIGGVSGLLLAIANKGNQLLRIKKTYIAIACILIGLVPLIITTKDALVVNSTQGRVMGKDETLGLINDCSINYLELQADNSVRVSYARDTDKKAQRAEPVYWSEYLAQAVKSALQNKCDYIVNDKDQRSNIPAFFGHWLYDDIGSPYTKMDIETNEPGVLVAWRDERPFDGNFICLVYKADTHYLLATYEASSGFAPGGVTTDTTYGKEEVVARSTLDRLLNDHCLNK